LVLGFDVDNDNPLAVDFNLVKSLKVEAL
jgi:hypothetical protein